MSAQIIILPVVRIERPAAFVWRASYEQCWKLDLANFVEEQRRQIYNGFVLPLDLVTNGRAGNIVAFPRRKDVDGRDKPGHDDEGPSAA